MSFSGPWGQTNQTSNFLVPCLNPCSVGNLGHSPELTQVVALLQRLNETVGESRMAVKHLPQAMAGLARLSSYHPGRYNDLAQLSQVAALCSMFMGLVGSQGRLVKHGEDWARFVRACGERQCNPIVGDEGRSFFDVVLSQLPIVGGTLSPFASTHAVQGLATFYGLPCNGSQLAPALQPHRAFLGAMGRRAQRTLNTFLNKERWALAPGEEERMREAVRAFAALG